jgi:hypothetical protein
MKTREADTGNCIGFFGFLWLNNNLTSGHCLCKLAKVFYQIKPRLFRIRQTTHSFSLTSGQENAYHLNMGKNKSFDPTREINDKEAQDLICDIKLRGFVHLSNHAEDRMLKRGFSMRDVLNILEHGTIVSKEYNEEAQNWKYKIEGQGIDGEKGAAVTAIINSSTQMIITVF